MSTQFTNRQWRLPNNENKAKQSNYSMDFDGSSSEVSMDFTNTGSTGSISVWIKPTDYTTGAQIVWLYVGSGYRDFIALAQRNDGTLSFSSADSGSTRWAVETDNAVVSNGTWTHVVFSFDGSNGIIYINGSTVPQTYITTTDKSWWWGNLIPTNLRLGILRVNGYSVQQRYYGQIDGVSIYNYPLSSSQVTTLYGSSSTGIGNPMSLSPKPVAYYPLGDQDAFNGANYLVPNSSLKDYVFDFVPNDYIDLGNDVFFNTNNPFSFSTWVNLDSYSDPYPYLANLKTNVTDGIGIFISNDSSYAGVNVGSTDSSITKGRTTGDISGTFLNSWNQVVVTYNGNGANTLSNFSIYVNGSPVTLTSTGTFGTMPNTANNIGRRSNNYHYLDGKMSNVQIFNTNLSSTEVETLYNYGSPIQTLANIPQNSSLQGWWKLDASATYDGSNWSIPDDSTNSNTGTSSGMSQANLVQSDLSFTSGYSPYALDFDGTDDYISLPTITLTDNWSVSVWMNQTTLKTRSQAVGTSTGTGFWAYSGDIRSGGSIAGRLIYYNGASLVALSNERLDDGNWHNWIISYDHSTTTLKCYIDGQENYSDTYNAGTGNTINRISNNFASNYWLGQLSNISIWNTALTSSQVSEIYNEGVPSNLNNHSAYSNLVSWWQLGSNSSFNTNWTVLDEKGTNNGTSVNMGEDATVDGVGSYANGLSSGMGGDEVIGDAPYSSSNSLSVNMDVLDRVTDTPS